MSETSRDVLEHFSDAGLRAQVENDGKRLRAGRLDGSQNEFEIFRTCRRDGDCEPRLRQCECSRRADPV